MLLSSYSKYGLRAMIRLAILSENGEKPATVREIANTENISIKYLESIFSILKRSGLITARKGKTGGYRLIRDPSQITVLEIIEALEGRLSPVECLTHQNSCNFNPLTCTVHPLWTELYSTINNTLQKYTLNDIMKDILNNQQNPVVTH